MKQNRQNGTKRVNVNVDLIQAFVILNNAGVMINAYVMQRNDK